MFDWKRGAALKIGELAKATGLTAKTIRFYEVQGIIPDPPRTNSGYRTYGDSDVVRLEFVLKAKRLGLSLGEIKGVLRLHDRSEPTCLHVRSLLEEKVAQVEAAIRDLASFKEELQLLGDRATGIMDCRPLGANICSIIEDSGINIAPSSLAWAESTGSARLNL